MIMQKILIALIFLFSANLATAKPYFDITTINQNLIDPPFAIGDEKWQNEVALIIEKQNNFNSERLSQAALEKELTPETLALKINPNLTREKYPKLYLLLNRTGETSYKLTHYFKDYFAITRPYLASDKIKNLIEPSKGYSYPSGHTSGSYIYAYVLGMVFIDKKTEFMNLAAQIADNRILVGMHYPQDINGGKQLALLAIGALSQNKEFLRDLKNAQKEALEKNKSQ